MSDRELMERLLLSAKADAWDEGYTACLDDRNYEPGYGAGNPYRTTEGTADHE